MVNIIRGDQMPHESQHYRVALYHDLPAETIESVVNMRLITQNNRARTRKNECWEYAGTYIDCAYDGTVLPNRKGFSRLLDDARAGKFDMIITPTPRHFAATTDATLQITEELLALPAPVTVYFEKDMLNSEFIHEILPLLREVDHE